MPTRIERPTIRGIKSFCAATKIIVLAGAALLLTSEPSDAQESCTTSALSNPTRQLVTCGAALSLERTARTDITIFERRGDAPPKTIELENGAIFIEVLPGSRPTQIRTPHAIAAVRGTTYVVESNSTSTSVFVVKGGVSVSRPDSSSTVVLGPGEGVDVDPANPLVVGTWSTDRVEALLARFGR